MPDLVSGVVIGVITPVLNLLGLDQYRMRAATELLLGTAIQESGLVARRQANGGPALGLFQMEPATHDDIWANFLHFRPSLAQVVGTVAAALPAPELLETNDEYAAAMCRVHYMRMGQIVGQTPLPVAGDIHGMAAYWKRFYNTILGAGTEAEFMAHWESHDPEF